MTKNNCLIGQKRYKMIKMKAVVNEPKIDLNNFHLVVKRKQSRKWCVRHNG